MQKVQNVLYQLQKSINSLKIDYELLQRLKAQIISKPMHSDHFQSQIKLLLQLYDLSNNQRLYTVRKSSISLNEMAIELKIMVCRLMSTIITYFQRQQSITLIPIQFLAQGIQIMILSVRVCLNQAQSKFISQLQQCYNFIHSPFDYVLEFLAKNIQFYHQLNVLELIRYKCENQSFTIMDFQKRLAIISSYQEFTINQYRNFVSHLVMEIVLKSLKNGKLNTENVQQFFPFLSEQNQKELLSLIIATGNSTKNLQTSSGFLEIYNQIQNYGIQSINLDYLEEFIKNQKNFNDERIFQVAALTLQPDFLEIWFRVLNTKKEKSPLLQKAFLCYIHVVESILGQKNTERSQNLSKLLKLSNTIIFTLLTEKKSNHSQQQPVLNIIKTLMKVLTELCFSVDREWKETYDFGERIVLICSRFQCMQVSKVIYTLLLYCSLIKKQNVEDIYLKFQAHYNNDKSSQIYRLLSTAYLLRNSHQSSLDLESMKSFEMFKQPFIMILFAQNQEDMTIFDFDIQEFKQMNNKFQIYFEMIKKYEQNQENLLKILQHLETFVLKTKLEQLSKVIEESVQQKTNLRNLMMFLIEFLEQQESSNFQLLKNPSVQGSTGKYQQASNKKINDFPHEKDSSIKVCFILINFFILLNHQMVGQLREVSGGVLLNKYSQKIKMIAAVVEMVRKSNVQVESQLYNICCCYLIVVLEKFKKSFVKKERIGEPGQVSFIHSIQELVTIFQSIQQRKASETEKQINSKKESKRRPEQSKDVRKNFIEFIIFQIDCLTNNHEKYMKIVDEMQTNQLRTYSHSVYIPKALKQKILRRIVRQNLMQSGSQISLRQFKEIIELTEDQEELQLYMKYVFCSFGEEGRKMLLLIAHQNKRLQRILLRDTEIEI